MLILIRSKVGSIVAKFFAFFLILGFGAWGIQDMLGYQVGGGGAVAEVGEVKLGPQRLYSDVYSEINRYRRIFGTGFSIDQARQLGVIDNVLNRQINAAAVQLGAQDLGVAVSDDMVRAAIVAEPMFKGMAGNFDRNRFQELLANNGLTEQGYVAQVREQLSTQQLVGSLAGGARAPKSWVDTVYRYRQEQRDVDTAFVADEKLGTIAEPTDAELRKHYKDNEKTFTAPELRAVSFLRLDAADLAKEVAIADDAVRKAYDDRADEFTTKEKRHIQQMILDSEEKAKKAHAQINEGKTFIAVAKEVAGQDEKTVDLGEITEADLLPDLAKAAFALAQGVTSAPQKSALGWHLFKAVEVKAGGVKSFDEVKTKLRGELAQEKAVDAVFDLSNNLEDKLGGGATIEEAASALNLKVEKLAALDRNGKDGAGTAIANLPGGQAFAGIAFGTVEGEDSTLNESGDNGFYIMRVDKITKPALRPFDTVKVKVAEAWKAARRKTAAEAIAKDVLKAVNGGAKLADAVTEWALEVKPVAGVTRDGKGGNDGLDAGLIGKIFGLQPGKAAIGRVGEGYRVAVLSKVTAAGTGRNAKDAAAARKAVADSLSDAIRDDLNGQLVAALRDAAGVEIFRQTVDSLFGDQPRQAQP